MKSIQPDAIAEVMRDVAWDIILPRWKTLKEHEIDTKSGPNDFVTIADLEAEARLTKILKDMLSGSQVVGEEAVSKNQISMGLLATESDPLWVVDPVDGTANFKDGTEKFGMIIALVHKGQTVQGWILDIPADRIAITERGSGVQVNGQRKTYPVMTNPIKETRGFISRKFLPEKMKKELEPVLNNEFDTIETHLCCAHEYLDILEGRAFFSLYSRIRPWDHLAGAMMMEEAGGYVRKWDGSRYRVGDECGGLICAQDEEVWQEICGLLLKGYPICHSDRA